MKTSDIDIRSEIVDQVRNIIGLDISRDEKLMKICELLEVEIDTFDWVGFYLVNPDSEKELILGPFVGEPTDHKKIPFGKGICGQAAESMETFVVQDVNQESNYLACSLEVQAEIVVPILKDHEIVGELDVDSHTRNSITEEQRKLLEIISALVADIF